MNIQEQIAKCETRGELLQLVASGISGYHPNKNCAKNDFYYELTCMHTKLLQIDRYSNTVYEITLSVPEILDIFNFLENDYINSNDRFYAFKKLADENTYSKTS